MNSSQQHLSFLTNSFYFVLKESFLLFIICVTIIRCSKCANQSFAEGICNVQHRVSRSSTTTHAHRDISMISLLSVYSSWCRSSSPTESSRTLNIVWICREQTSEEKIQKLVDHENHAQDVLFRTPKHVLLARLLDHIYFFNK